MQDKVAPTITFFFLLRSRSLSALLSTVVRGFVRRAKQTKNIHISTKKNYRQKLFMWNQKKGKRKAR